MKNPNKLFPLFITDALEETKKYYVERAGFSVSMETDNYVQVAYGDGPELAFMKPNAFPDGKARPAFQGNGVIVSIPTPDADKKYGALKKIGAELLSEPSDKPWGWRSFMAVDPNGLVLDFFHVAKENPTKDAAS